MGTDDRTVVVTGLGATTPLGGDVESTWAAMLAGRSGVRALTDDWAEDLPARIAGVAAVDPAEVLGRVQARRMDRCEQFALVAAREAWADAGSPDVDPERLGVVGDQRNRRHRFHPGRLRHAQGEGLAAASPLHRAHADAERRGRAGSASSSAPRLACTPTVSACASGAEAIGYAHRHDPLGPGRRGRRGRHRGGDHAAEPGRVRGDAGPVDCATTSRSGRPGRSTRAGTGSCSARAPASWCWSRPSTRPRRGARVYAIAAGAGYSSDAHHIAQPAPGRRRGEAGHRPRAG